MIVHNVARVACLHTLFSKTQQDTAIANPQNKTIPEQHTCDPNARTTLFPTSPPALPCPSLTPLMPTLWRNKILLAKLHRPQLRRSTSIALSIIAGHWYIRAVGIFIHGFFQSASPFDGRGVFNVVFCAVFLGLIVAGGGES